MANSQFSDSGAGQSTERERRVVELLEENDRRLTVGGLAEEMSRGTGIEADPATVHEDLFENVLPALHEAGRIQFDDSRGVVSSPQEGLRARLSTRSVQWLVRSLGALVVVVALFKLLLYVT